MRRREFVTLLGGAAAWPFGARAQQPAMTVIGLLSSVTAREWAPFIAAFLQGLNEVGFVADLQARGAAINADGATIDEIVSHHSCKIAERAGALAIGRSLRSAGAQPRARFSPRTSRTFRALSAGMTPLCLAR